MTYLDTDAQLIRSLLPAGATPPDEANDLFVLYALLMRVKAEKVTAEDVHDAWSAWMRARDPQHSALVPYKNLPPEARATDEPYAEAIRQASLRRNS
ncbi:hypothetical protein E0504_48125 [Parafrankia sp. BMG5.11]|nr:hypothetical protein E0504_48125 [Parafrankia sp. BMG5.11]